MGVSVVINTYNAAQHLKEVLEAVADLDEILICDMYSTDETISIAQSFGARCIFHEKLPYVEPARNFAIQSAANEWVLLLDADEVVPVALKKFLLSMRLAEEKYSCIAIPRKNYFMGRFMRAAYPDYVYRFFKKECVYWPEFVHSAPTIQGKVFKIESSKSDLALEHLADDSVQTVLQKNNVYTTAEVNRRANQSVSFFNIVFSPLSWFFKFYILKKGFLDGTEGFIFAKLKAQYKFNTLSKISEARKRRTSAG